MAAVENLDHSSPALISFRSQKSKAPDCSRAPFVPPTELLARCQHPFEYGRGVVLPLSYETLLMCLEVGDAMPDLLALGLHPIHRYHPARFDDGARYQWFDTNALCKRHRLFDERIYRDRLSNYHCNFPPTPSLSAQAHCYHAAS